MRLSKKMARLGTESAFQVLAQAQALEARGIDVIHLEIGEPDYATPANIAEAAARAVRDRYTHYCNSQGIVQLRTAIAREIEKTRGIRVDPDRIVVTTGAKPIMFYAILALDMIERLGPRSSFLTEKHTAENFRKFWVPSLFDRSFIKTAEAVNAESKLTRKTLHLMMTHKPKPLSDDILKALHEVELSYLKRLGLKDYPQKGAAWQQLATQTRVKVRFFVLLRKDSRMTFWSLSP